MKKTKPKTENKLDDIWQDDVLGRRDDAEFLISFLTHRIKERKSERLNSSYVLNIDAQWGHGKTFFLSRLRKHLICENHLVAYVNAWEDDHADDPLIAVISEIDKVMVPYIKSRPKLVKAWEAIRTNGLEIATTTVKQGAGSILKRYLGEGINEIKDIVSNDLENPQLETTEGKSDPSSENGAIEGVVNTSVDKLLNSITEACLSRFRSTKNSIVRFRDQLGALLNEIEKKGDKVTPLFVLVDELDRCRPTYSIELLERIKHLFDVDNVVFIVATDSTKLQHSIKAVYGLGFEANRYLTRFFDRT